MNTDKNSNIPNKEKKCNSSSFRFSNKITIWDNMVFISHVLLHCTAFASRGQICVQIKRVINQMGTNCSHILIFFIFIMFSHWKQSSIGPV